MKVKATFGLVLALLLALVPASSLSSAKDKAEGPQTILLSSSNTIVLDSEIDGESTSKVIAEAKRLDAKMSGVKELISAKKPLYVFLNTPGGSIQAGLEMIEAMHGLGRPVHTITLFAASMGWQLAQNLGTRYILKNGVLMSHRASGGFEGQFGGKHPSQIDSRYRLWLDRMDELDAQTVARTKGKQTMESYQDQYASEMWLTGTKAVERAYADEVVTVKCDATLAGTTVHHAMVLGLIPVTFELDNCPINTSPMNVQVGFATNLRGFMNEADFIKAGGTFGPDCLVQSATDKTRLCALDTSLNLQRVHDLASDFTATYLAKKNKVVGYTEFR